MNPKRNRWVLGFAMVSFLFFGVLGRVEAEGSKSKKTKGEVKVTVEGELSAMDPKAATKAKGSDTKESQSPQYGIKVIKAMGEEGRAMSEIENKTLSLHKDSKSEALIKEHREGDVVTVQGRLQVDKAVLEVESYRKKEGSGSK